MDIHLISQEAAVVPPPYVALAIRPNPGFWEFVKVNSNDLSVDGIAMEDYLNFREMIVDETWYICIMFWLWFSLIYIQLLIILKFFMASDEMHWRLTSGRWTLICPT